MYAAVQHCPAQWGEKENFEFKSVSLRLKTDIR